MSREQRIDAVRITTNDYVRVDLEIDQARFFFIIPHLVSAKAFLLLNQVDTLERENEPALAAHLKAVALLYLADHQVSFDSGFSYRGGKLISGGSGGDQSDRLEDIVAQMDPSFRRPHSPLEWDQVVMEILVSSSGA